MLKNLDYYLFEGIKIKLNIVVEDEKEKGKRKFFNFGYIFGYVIEYEYKIFYGYVVMIGIFY